MKTALLRIAPIYADVVVADLESVPHMEMFDRGALKPFLDRPVKVLASHNRDEEIGVVKDLYVEEDAAGGVWQWALADLTDPPGWVAKGLPVSISFVPLRRMPMPGGWERIIRAGLTSVSILRPSESPAHPRARVASLRTPEPPKATRDDDVRFQEYAEAMAKKGVLVRRGIGQVLRVR